MLCCTVPALECVMKVPPLLAHVAVFVGAALIAAFAAAAEGKPAAVMAAKADYRSTKSDLDRSSGVPKVSDFPDLDFPKIQRGVLKNGMEIARAESRPEALALLFMSPEFQRR